MDHRDSGFSLVEVALSIGIISFALLAVVSLLPVGLATNRDSQEEAQAIQNLNAIAACIQAAKPTVPNASSFTALAPFGSGTAAVTNLKWTNGAPASTATIYLDVNGNPTASQTQATEVAFVRITPPNDSFSSGNAYICVAWPGLAASAKWAGNPSLPTITNMQGYVESTIYFISQ